MSKIFIISGPSGAGEDSVIKGLKEKIQFEKIVTTTTRPIRPGETEGVDYYFISKETFQNKIDNNEFFEWAKEDNDQLYGGTFAEINRVNETGKPVIWKIEWQGVITAKKLFPQAISIFIYVPMNVIESRLKKRRHNEEFIKNRLEYSQGWFNNEDIFDFKVENKDGELAKTIEKVSNIIKNS